MNAVPRTIEPVQPADSRGGSPLPGLSIREYCGLVEALIIDSAKIVDGKLVLMTIHLTLEERERFEALWMFLCRLMPKQRQVADLLKGNKR